MRNPCFFVPLFLFICSSLSTAKPASTGYYDNLGKPAFLAAQPVWPQGRETESASCQGFRTQVQNPKSNNVADYRLHPLSNLSERPAYRPRTGTGTARLLPGG